MAAPDRTARIRVSPSGLQMAGPGSPGAVHWHGGFGETCSAPSGELLICLGNESTPNRRRNPIISQPVERTVRRMKKTLLTIVQLLVTGALLYWVFHDPKVREGMAVAIRDADYRWIGAAILMYVVVEFAAIVRWQILLKVQGINLSNGRIAALFFIGMFYNQFLPGGTGGDIVKTYLLWKETPTKKPGALLAVLFDRMIGLIALILITGVLIFLRYGWLTSTPATSPYVWLVLIIFGASVLFVVTSFVVSGFNLFHKLPHRFPGREKMLEISAAYHLYARHWRATMGAFGASLVCHLGTFATFLCVAYAFRANIAPVDFFAIMPAARTISLLAIAFAGGGPHE